MGCWSDSKIKIYLITQKVSMRNVYGILMCVWTNYTNTRIIKSNTSKMYHLRLITCCKISIKTHIYKDVPIEKVSNSWKSHWMHRSEKFTIFWPLTDSEQKLMALDSILLDNFWLEEISKLKNIIRWSHRNRNEQRIAIRGALLGEGLDKETIYIPQLSIVWYVTLI